MKNKEYITSYGLFSTLVVTIVGIGIFSYPRELANLVGSDSWLETFFIGAICLIIVRLIWKVEEINGYMEFTDLTRRNLGKAFGDIILIIFAAVEIVVISLSMRTFTEVIKMYLLEKTPTEFLLLITILCGTYLVRGGIKSIIKFNEVALWMMFIPFILVLLLLLRLGDYTNLFPVLHNKPLNYVYALKYGVFSFMGIEMAFLVLPFLKDKKKASNTMGKSIIFITIFYAIITALVLAVFSKEHTKILLWPTITMVKSLDIPGAFIERWDGMVMALWALFFFTTFCNLYYFSSHIIKETFRLGDVKISSLVIVPFIYLIAMIPKNIGELNFAITTSVPMIFIFSLIVVPLLLYFTGIARAGRGKCN